MAKGDGLRFRTLERHPLVLEYDNHGMDEGRFMLTLVPGYAFDGAVTERGGDSRSTTHSASAGTVREALDKLRWAKPCVCDHCVAGRE